MRKLVTLLAMTTALPAVAIAQQQSDGSNQQSQPASGLVSPQDAPSLIRTSEMIGGEVYTLDSQDQAEWSDNPYYESVEDGWEQIGNVTDVVLNPNGEMTGIVVEVGGFLDIGDSTVLLNLDDAKLASVDEDNEYHFVTRYSEEELETLQEVEENWW